MNQGSVVAVGPGRRSMNGELIPVGLKEGDKVLLPDFGGVQVKLGSAGGQDESEYVCLLFLVCYTVCVCVCVISVISF